MAKQREIVIHEVPMLDSAHMHALETQDSARRACIAGRILFRELTEAKLLHEGKNLMIDWNEKERKFCVEFKGTLTHPTDVGHRFIRTFPVEIAERFTCRCGASLTLGDFTVQVSDTDIEFRAIYYCTQCSREIEARSKGLYNAILRWLRFIKRIKIGVSGIELEKDYEPE